MQSGGRRRPIAIFGIFEGIYWSFALVTPAANDFEKFEQKPIPDDVLRRVLEPWDWRARRSEGSGEREGATRRRPFNRHPYATEVRAAAFGTQSRSASSSRRQRVCSWPARGSGTGP